MPNRNNNWKADFVKEAKKLGRKSGDVLSEIVAQGIFEYQSQKYLKELSLKECVSWMKDMKTQYPSAKSCLISTEESVIPQTNETGIVVTLMLMDENNNPIPSDIDKEKAVSTIFHAETIDNSLIHILNGKKAALVDF